MPDEKYPEHPDRMGSLDLWSKCFPAGTDIKPEDLWPAEEFTAIADGSEFDLEEWNKPAEPAKPVAGEEETNGEQR
jgi:hypothetical protein